MGSMLPLPSRSLERERQCAVSQGSQLFALEETTSGPAPPEPPLPPCSGELAPLPPLPPSPQPVSAFAVSEHVHCADQLHAGQGTLEAFAHNEFVAGGCATIAPSAPKSLTSVWLDGHDGKAVSNDFSEWDFIAKGLYRHSSADCHTIRSLDSVDATPLGTDFRPSQRLLQFMGSQPGASSLEGSRAMCMGMASFACRGSWFQLRRALFRRADVRS